MQFITPPTVPTPPTPAPYVPLSLAQRASQIVAGIQARGQFAAQQELNAFLDAYNQIWHNPNKDLTRELMLAAMGAGAKEAFEKSYATYLHLVVLDAGTVVDTASGARKPLDPAYGTIPAGVVLTPNVDGSVTLGG